MIVSSYGLRHSNPETVIPRILISRIHNGNDIYSQLTNSYLAEKLTDQFSGPDIHIASEIEIPGTDIDFVLYNSNLNYVLISEIKTFINPDTVLDVWNSNEHINKGITQIETIKQWIDREGILQLSNRLDFEIATDTDIVYTVLTNGFSGSDYLEHPDYINIIDCRFMLMNEYKSRDIRIAIMEYEQKLHKFACRFWESRTNKKKVKIGDYILIVPDVTA